MRPYSSPTKEVTRAMEEMADELLQDSPRVDFLKTKMWESFPYRKHFYEKKPNIGVMFEIFPALRDWRIVSKIILSFVNKDTSVLFTFLVEEGL